MTTTPRRVRALGLVLAPLLLVIAPAVASAADAASSDHDCTELVTHAPSGTQGDATSVAITSQVLVADVDGWEAVAWEASDGVEVDAVLVDTAEGTEVLDGTPTGHAEEAHQLTFCGEVVEMEAAGAAGSADANLAGPLTAAGVPLIGAAVGGLLAGLVLLSSFGGRRTGRDHGTFA